MLINLLFTLIILKFQFMTADKTIISSWFYRIYININQIDNYNDLEGFFDQKGCYIYYLKIKIMWMCYLLTKPL